MYDPPQSPWCADNFYLERQFPEMHTRHPSGIFADDMLPNGPYKDPNGAIIHAWRPGHWYAHACSGCAAWSPRGLLFSSQPQPADHHAPPGAQLQAVWL